MSLSTLISTRFPVGDVNHRVRMSSTDKLETAFPKGGWLFRVCSPGACPSDCPQTRPSRTGAAGAGTSQSLLPPWRLHSADLCPRLFVFTADDPETLTMCPASCLSNLSDRVKILCALLSVWSLAPWALIRKPDVQAMCPCVAGKYLKSLWGRRKKLSFHLATVLSSSLELHSQSGYILLEAPASHAWKTPLPSRGGWITGASLPKAPVNFLPLQQLQVNKFCSVFPPSL